MGYPSPQTADIQDPAFPITAAGSDYLITISLASIDHTGFTTYITKEQFVKIMFDHTYKSPWIAGELILTDDVTSYLSNNPRGDFGGARAAEHYGEQTVSYGDEPSKTIKEGTHDINNAQYSGHLVGIKVQTPATLATRCKKITLVDQYFFVTNIAKSAQSPTRSHYFFVQADAAPLLYSKEQWSTSNIKTHQVEKYTPAERKAAAQYADRAVTAHTARTRDPWAQKKKLFLSELKKGGKSALKESLEESIRKASVGGITEDYFNITRTVKEWQWSEGWTDQQLRQEIENMFPQGMHNREEVVQNWIKNLSSVPGTELGVAPDPLPEDITQFSADQKRVFVSDAIKDILETFCSKADYDIIHDERWDRSGTKTELSTNSTQRPIDALFSLMSQYISLVNQDMGLLRLHGGKYSLTSLTSLITNSGQFNYHDQPFLPKENFAGVLEIQTNDTRSKYSKKQVDTVWEKHIFSIPVKQNNIQFIDKQSTDGADSIVDVEVHTYDPNSKAFKFIREPGSLKSIRDKWWENIGDSFPDSKYKQLNAGKNILTEHNKKYIYNHSQTLGDEYKGFTGKAMTQQNILDKSNKAIIDIVGNFEMSAAKCIGIHIPGPHLQTGAPGIWFILNNTTTITPKSFETQLICSQLDTSK